MIKFFAAAEDDIEPADEAGRDDKDQVSSCPLELKLAEDCGREWGVFSCFVVVVVLKGE